MTPLHDTLTSLQDALPRLRDELDTLQAIKRWAGDSLPIQSGDRVQIISPAPSRARTWEPYAQAVAAGRTGTVREVSFNTHRRLWQATVTLDRLWSLHTTGAQVVRRWHGPADQTPDGYEPPSPSDQARHPEGTALHHAFQMNVAWLAKTDQP